MTDREQVNASVADVVSHWSHIDVLVNNAVLAVFEPFETRPLEKTRREFEVNYFGALGSLFAGRFLRQHDGEGIAGAGGAREFILKIPHRTYVKDVHFHPADLWLPLLTILINAGLILFERGVFG